MKMFAIALMVALVSGAALAQEPAPNAPIANVPYNSLSEEFSLPGETMDQFVVRIAPILDEFTARTEWEICGVIGQDENGRFGVLLGSVQAALTCVTNPLMVPQGMKDTGQSVHSHPRTKTVRPTSSDRYLRKLSGAIIPLKEEESNRGSHSFSIHDFDAGPGYLVSAGRILHQSGRGQVRPVGKLEKMAPIRNFAQR